MRNPLKRKTGAAKPNLQARLAGAKAKMVAVKEKYGRTLRAHRVLNAPPTAPTPAVDRVVLVNYATFLALERERVCAELYPHMGAKASRFVIGMNAAEAFFYPADGRRAKDVPPASSRALKVLDLVGIDWNANTDESDRARYDEGGRADTGERPAVPFGWPALDAALTEALDDLTRLDAAISALVGTGIEARDGDTAPGYEALNEARDDVLDRLVEIRARGLPGLQAKALAILTDGVSEILGGSDRLAKSLARDVVGARPAVLDQHRADPILAALAEYDRLRTLVCADQPADWPDDSLEADQGARGAAVIDHWRDVVLKTVPHTAEGCRALARATVAHHQYFACTMDSGEGVAAFDLIARSPLRA